MGIPQGMFNDPFTNLAPGDYTGVVGHIRPALCRPDILIRLCCFYCGISVLLGRLLNCRPNQLNKSGAVLQVAARATG
jgi:hypothetical protein